MGWPQGKTWMHASPLILVFHSIELSALTACVEYEDMAVAVNSRIPDVPATAKSKNRERLEMTRHHMPARRKTIEHIAAAAIECPSGGSAAIFSVRTKKLDGWACSSHLRGGTCSRHARAKIHPYLRQVSELLLTYR